jgi:hypothetical protein
VKKVLGVCKIGCSPSGQDGSLFDEVTLIRAKHLTSRSPIGEWRKDGCADILEIAKQRLEPTLGHEVGMRALAFRQETLHNLSVYTLDASVGLVKPAAQVRHQPELVCGREVCVAEGCELGAKSIEVGHEGPGDPDQWGNLHGVSFRQQAGRAPGSTIRIMPRRKDVSSSERHRYAA